MGRELCPERREVGFRKIVAICIGGDGAEQVKEGVEYFPGAVYCLDRYHLNRRLIKALCHDEEAFKKTCTAIFEGDWGETQAAITEAALDQRKASGRRGICNL